MSFDDRIDRTGTDCAKWDAMEPAYGVPPGDGLAMWVADTDFRAPDPVQRALRARIDHGIYGYPGPGETYRERVRWWHETRHGWSPEPSHIVETHGLVNAVGLALDAFTRAGEAVVLFTPVYHAFAKVIRAAGRTVTECPMPIGEDGLYRMDLDDAAARLTGRESLLILCSPHNPGGRVWSTDELAAVARFARENGLLLISDEVHQDIVYPGATFTPMARIAEPDLPLVVMTAASKTFNIAGAGNGAVMIADPHLRRRFLARRAAMGLSPDIFGRLMTEAAYTQEGADWVDALVGYLDANRRLFHERIAAIRGARAMPLQSTYLAWVDFAGTGLSPAEVRRRVEGYARIAANRGETFGPGGEAFLRFNFGMPRAQVEEAADRLVRAFNGTA